MNPTTGESWTIELRAFGPGPPAECRVRRLLKFALRGCGLRAVNVDASGPGSRLARPQETRTTPKASEGRSTS